MVFSRKFANLGLVNNKLRPRLSSILLQVPIEAPECSSHGVGFRFVSEDGESSATHLASPDQNDRQTDLFESILRDNCGELFQFVLSHHNILPVYTRNLWCLFLQKLSQGPSLF